MGKTAKNNRGWIKKTMKGRQQGGHDRKKMLGLVNMRYKGDSVSRQVKNVDTHIPDMFHMAYYLALPGAPEDQGHGGRPGEGKAGANSEGGGEEGRCFGIGRGQGQVRAEA